MFKDVAAQADHISTDGKFHYARSVFDWATLPEDLLPACCETPDKFSPQSDDVTAVYVIGPPEADYAKIGITRDPLDRLSGLQTANWHPLKLHYVLLVFDGRAWEVEQAALILARQAYEGRGEWVGCPAKDAFLCVLRAAAGLGVQACNYEALHETNVDMAACRIQSLRAIERRAKAEKFARLGY